jgi:hypothetical protein
MAKTAPKPDEVTNRRTHWQDEIARALKRYESFNNSGKATVDRYRLERQDSGVDVYKDRYNILYSSTETVKSSLYAQTPTVEAVQRHKDRQNDTAMYATLLIEAATQYAVEEVDFDDVMNNVVEDFLLPGMGQAWVVYEPDIKYDEYDEKGNGKEDTEYLAAEGLNVEYVHYRDFLMGVSRTWASVPWVSRRVYFDQPKAKKRFGAEKAAQLTYSYKPHDKNDGSSRSDTSGGGNQAIVYEIWDKASHKAIWYSDDFPGDVLDEIADPLKLRGFFPCPRPLRAVSNTRTMVPKSFYSQYKAQAEELDLLTEKIRYLTEALRVLGVFDGSNASLANLLQGKGNKMVSIENWAQFAGTGGIQGAIQWVPVTEVATVLTQLFQQREIVKNEIYEITGFSDIQRGISKASETLGAQQIKNQWAGGRLRNSQKEVQRFCRDVIRIMSEIICEQFSDTSLALYGGFDPPPITDAEQAAAVQYAQAQLQPPAPPMPGAPPPPPPTPPPPTMQAQAIQQFKKVVKLLKDERQRCAVIGVETDSTIQPDEQQERQDRMLFLSSMGAFLQQAIPAAMQFPDMRGLLGSIMMFTARTFRASRSIEKDFEDFQKKLANAPAAPPPGKDGGGDPAGDAAKVQADMQMEQMRTQAESARNAADNQTAQAKIAADTRTSQMKLQQDHEYRMAEIQLKNRELALREREVVVKERELGIQAAQAETGRIIDTHEAALAAADLEHTHQMALQDGDRADRALENDQANAEADRAQNAAQGAAEPQNEA